MICVNDPRSTLGCDDLSLSCSEETLFAGHEFCRELLGLLLQTVFGPNPQSKITFLL